MLHEQEHNKVTTQFYLVPLQELLVIEGWQMRFDANSDGSGTLRAENPHYREAWLVPAASEDTAVNELARRTGWYKQ